MNGDTLLSADYKKASVTFGKTVLPNEQAGLGDWRKTARNGILANN